MPLLLKIMKFYIRIAFPVFITALVYTFLSCFFGPKGLYSQRFLENQRDVLINHIELIKQTGLELDVFIQNLTADPETIEVFAHDLGYIRDNERIIKLTGFSSGVRNNFEHGSLMSLKKASFISDYLCKTIAFSLGILTALFELVLLKIYAN